MKIYIDESGVFTKGISCTGALVIPDGYYPSILKRYLRLRNTLPLTNGEVKGKTLNEKQVAKVIEMLRRSDVLFEVSAINMDIEDEERIKNHRDVQAQKIIEGLTDKHHENAWKFGNRLREQLLNIPPPLYAQFVLFTGLMERVFQHSTLYYCQRQPKELGSFGWVIDAKDKNYITNAEEWWRSCIKPFLQSRSLDAPLRMLEGADYSYFKKLEGPIPEYLPHHRGDPDTGADLNKVFGDISFKAGVDYGLELVDILTNTVRRALAGNLQSDGWQDIGSLIILAKDERRIRFLTFSAQDVTVKGSVLYKKVVLAIDKQGKSMLTRSMAL